MRFSTWTRLFSILKVSKDLGALASVITANRFWFHHRRGTVNLHPSVLGGNGVICRVGTTDWPTFISCFVDQFHMPPKLLSRVRTIFDCGANVGYTAAHLASAFPEAFVVAVEMEPENFLIAQKNTEAWRNRVVMVQAAIWEHDGEAYFSGDREDAYKIIGDEGGSRNGNRGVNVRNKTQTISIGTLIRQMGIKQIDYLKMDIEGAEENVLLRGNTSWLSQVQALHLEIHDSDLTGAFCDVLRGAGLQVMRDDRHWSAIFAFRL